MSNIFENRIEAGKQLAKELFDYKDKALVLAIPRGGVPVGYEIAKHLHVPLDTVVVRKLGAPSNPEFGIGAIGPSGVVVLDDASIRSTDVQPNDLDWIIAQEREEMDRRIVAYKNGEYSKNSPADTVILVDDGLATGVSARAAIESVTLTRRPKRIIFAAPICARDSAQSLKDLVDEGVCLSEVDDLIAVGKWYRDFRQTTDEEVIQYLEEQWRKA